MVDLAEGDFTVATVPGSDRRLIVCPTTEYALGTQHCVFCGVHLTGRRSREHIFPRWLTEHHGNATTPVEIRWMADWSHELLGERKLTLSNLVAGRVCRPCNNGWMSQLEDQVVSPLVELASGDRRPAELATHERELIARWATKTAFALRVADLGPRVVDSSHMQALANGGMPPVRVVARQATVDLGLSWCTTQWWMINYPPHSIVEVSRLVGRSHKTILTIGHLVVAICFWPDPRWPLLISRHSHVPLWPERHVWLTYPHATDRHGARPNRETEIIDMVVGTRVAHPGSKKSFTLPDAP
jgi:hypothetical protein